MVRLKFDCIPEQFGFLIGQHFIDNLGTWTAFGIRGIGMTTTAEILTGKTTVWNYLTRPIFKTVSQSMQEQ